MFFFLVIYMRLPRDSVGINPLGESPLGGLKPSARCIHRAPSTPYGRRISEGSWCRLPSIEPQECHGGPPACSKRLLRLCATLPCRVHMCPEDFSPDRGTMRCISVNGVVPCSKGTDDIRSLSPFKPVPRLRPWLLLLHPDPLCDIPSRCSFLNGPGQSPVVPFACFVGLLSSDGRCGLRSLWCCFCVSCWCMGVVLVAGSFYTFCCPLPSASRLSTTSLAVFPWR